MGTLGRFIKEKWLEIVIVAIGIQFATSGASMFMGNKPIIAIVTGAVLVLLAVAATAAADILKRRHKKIGDGNALHIRRKGVIFTVGLRSSQWA